MKYINKLLSGNNNYGKLVFLIGLLVSFPIVVLVFYPEESEYIPAFLAPLGISIVLGLIMHFLFSSNEEKVKEWQTPLERGSLPVLFAWCYAFFAGALPFVIAGKLNMLQALFESVSGWTTTGLSVVDVEAMPQIFLFHRSFMNYCGGLGFVIVIVMLIRGKQSMNLYSAEGHPDRIMPSLKRTARSIFYLYASLQVIGTAMYAVCGMNLFDSICHTMSALSTAGFSTRADSIAYYDSVPIEIVSIILMFVGAVNFAILFLGVKRKFKQMLQVSEFRFTIYVTVVFTLLIAVVLVYELDMGIGESILEALFGVVTTFSTTGYATMNLSLWPQFAVGLVVLLMIIGGEAGSTAGGIKMSRTYLMIRITVENIRKRFLSARQITPPYYHLVQGKTPIESGLIQDTFGFITCYMGIFIVGSLLLTLTADSSFFDAVYEFASALGNIGISNGITRPDASAGTLIIEIVGMALGRLEIFIVFIGLYAGFHGLTNLFNKQS